MYCPLLFHFSNFAESTRMEAKSLPAHSFPDGCIVRVVPGTGPNVRGENIESYIGRVVKKVDDVRYKVRKLEPGSKGKLEHVSSMMRHTTFEDTPLTKGKVSWRDLSEASKRRLMKTAEEAVSSRIKKMEKDFLSCKSASIRAMEANRVRHLRALKKIHASHELVLRAMEEDHKRDREVWMAERCNLFKRVDRLQRQMKEASSNVLKTKSEVEVAKGGALEAEKVASEKNVQLQKAMRKSRDLLKRVANLSRKLKDNRSEMEDAKAAITDLKAEVWEAMEKDENKKSFKIREGGRGNPCTHEFERFVRSLMSTGMSAEACRHATSLAAKYFLGEKVGASLDIPKTTWFKDQREAAGNEAWLYAIVDIAGADEILQHGCDETGVSGVGTFSQWVLTKTNGNMKVNY